MCVCVCVCKVRVCAHTVGRAYSDPCAPPHLAASRGGWACPCLPPQVWQRRGSVVRGGKTGGGGGKGTS